MEDVRIADLPPALAERPEGKLPCFTLREGAAFWPADNDFTFNRLRSLAHRRLMHQRHRRGHGQTSAALFGVDDFAAAAALMALMDAGIADAEVTTAASNALYAWDTDLNPYRDDGYPHPVSAALIGTLARAEFWTLRVTTFVHGVTRERRRLSVCARDDAEINSGALLDPAFLPAVTVHVCLAPLLLPFARAFPRPAFTPPAQPFRAPAFRR